MIVKDVEDLFIVAYHPVWDLVRLAQITAAAIVILWLIRVAVTRHKEQPLEEFARWCFIGMASSAMLGTIQAGTAMGEPFVLWRTPLFLFTLLCFWRAVSLRL